MKRQCVIISAVFVTAVLLSSICFGAIPEYEIIDLGSLGGGFRTSAYGINDAGQVVGHSWNSDGDERAFLWDSANGMIDLGTLGSSRSWAHAINNIGQVVGYSRTAGGGYYDNHAFLWDSTNGMVDMCTVGVPALRRPWGINDAGQVVGDFGLWENGVVTDLGTLGGSSSSAWGINNAGQVVGRCNLVDGGPQHAFIWDSINGMVDLGTLDGFSSSYARGINNAGQVVGSSGGRAVLWEDGQVIQLADPFGMGSEATAINDLRQVVIRPDNDEDFFAYYWDSVQGLINLEDLVPSDSGWEYFQTANSINNYGQIVGCGFFNGEERAFLMTPTIPGPQKYYVDADAAGNNNGSSWADAFNYPQDALAAAQSGDEIWVAQGTYTPDSNTAHPDGTGDREATFQLKNGVVVKGGYAGYGEPDPNARNIELHETILSGDLAGNDGPDFANAENSYHVITGSGTDETAVLDGFTITSGNANGSDEDDCGGGMYIYFGSPTVSNCNFIANEAKMSGGGGGMYNENNSSPTLTNCTFSGNWSSGYGSGMYNIQASNPTLTDCTFSQNLVHLNGSGMYNENSSPTLTGCTFSGNETLAMDGGGMYNDGSNPTLTNCTFTGNLSYEHGGGMRNWESSPMLTNCTFSQNSAYVGGGMDNHDSNPTLTNCTFSDNLGWDYGGGMHNHSGSSPTLLNCTFSENTAYWGGGMSNQVNSNPTLVKCTFSDNSGRGYGGGMYNFSLSSPTLSNCTFSQNSAYYNGGGIYNTCRGNPTLRNCTFSSNSVEDGFGGGMYNFYSDPMLTDCTFKSNQAWRGGGIFNSEESNPTFTNCTFNGDLDGMVNEWYSNPTLTNCAFMGNLRGMRNQYDSNPTLTNCTFIANNEGIDCSGGITTLTNCIFSGNRFALFFDRSNSRLTNCSSTGNYVGLETDGDSVVTLTNCILWGNNRLIFEHDFEIISYTCIQGGWPGLGNIDLDPQFVDPCSDNYHLLPGSPCIDAGNNTAVPAGITTDLDGNPRFVDQPEVPDTGNGTAPIVDMGAFEANYIEVPMKFTPQALNLSSGGKLVKAHFVLPEGFSVEDVDANTPAVIAQFGVESYDIKVLLNDEGLVKVEATFRRSDLCSSITGYDQNIEIMAIGRLTTGQQFYGTDIIKITDRAFEHLAVFVSYWLEADCFEPDWCGGADLNQDSVVNFLDFALLDRCCIEVLNQ